MCCKLSQTLDVICWLQTWRIYLIAIFAVHCLTPSFMISIFSLKLWAQAPALTGLEAVEIDRWGDDREGSLTETIFSVCNEMGQIRLSSWQNTKDEALWSGIDLRFTMIRSGPNDSVPDSWCFRISVCDLLFFILLSAWIIQRVCNSVVCGWNLRQSLWGHFL